MTSPLKVRVEYSCGSVEYTTACSTGYEPGLRPLLLQRLYGCSRAEIGSALPFVAFNGLTLSLPLREGMRSISSHKSCCIRVRCPLRSLGPER